MALTIRKTTEVDGAKFSLSLTPDGEPYVLKRWVRGAWYISWANWHKGLPHGIQARAVKAMGFVWDNAADPPRWVPA